MTCAWTLLQAASSVGRGLRSDTPGLSDLGQGKMLGSKSLTLHLFPMHLISIIRTLKSYFPVIVSISSIPIIMGNT